MVTLKSNYDFVIVGAGIVGLAIAKELQIQGHKDILLIEKENELALHSSGRNSGVLHAGIYYAPGTLKSQVCVEGRSELKEFSKEHKLPFIETGKVIVCNDEFGLKQIGELHRRATVSGATAEIIDLQTLKTIEPYATTYKKALYSPKTAVVSPKDVVKKLASLIIDQGAKIIFNTEIKSINSIDKSIDCNGQKIGYGHLVNTAGLNADIVARPFNIGRNYKILPFRGSYWEIVNPKVADQFKGSIYPVPDINIPFLGVHITRTADNKVYIGPTAFPAFGREHYKGLEGINFNDFKSITMSLVDLYVAKKNIRQLVTREMERRISSIFLEEVNALSPHVKKNDLAPSKKVGIRAQLYNIRKKELVMDFVVESSKNSTHVLNAVSPAFTSSFPFGRHVVNNYIFNRTEV